MNEISNLSQIQAWRNIIPVADALSRVCLKKGLHEINGCAPRYDVHFVTDKSCPVTLDEKMDFSVSRVFIVPMSLNRLVSLNGKHNFNRKQTRLYTEL